MKKVVFKETRFWIKSQSRAPGVFYRILFGVDKLSELCAILEGKVRTAI